MFSLVIVVSVYCLVFLIWSLLTSLVSGCMYLLVPRLRSVLYVPGLHMHFAFYFSYNFGDFWYSSVIDISHRMHNGEVSLQMLCKLDDYRCFKLICDGTPCPWSG